MLEHKFLSAREGLSCGAGQGNIGHGGEGHGVEGHVIEGYASLFETRDHAGDIVQKGAYAASLAKAAAKGGQVKMLWQHDPCQPIGLWQDLREDHRGLWVKGVILADVARGRDVAALVAAGAIDGLSIGYRSLRSAPEGKGRRLIELDLWEISLVTFPMLPEARLWQGLGGKSIHLARISRLFEAAREDLAARSPIVTEVRHE